MIVVIGSPAGTETPAGVVASGMPTEISRAAVAAGADVQLVGKIGADQTGDAVILSLAARGIGHAALLREAGQQTPVILVREPDAADTTSAERGQPQGLPLDAADVELALRYLPDYRVIVMTTRLDTEITRAIVAAARWAGAALVAVVGGEGAVAGLTPEATVLKAPAADPDGAFAAFVGAYAAGLDRGAPPAEAFETASRGVGATAVTD